MPMLMPVSALLAATVRTFCHPLRWFAVKLRRGHPVRSAAVWVLKKVSHGPWLQGLARFSPLDAPDVSFQTSDSLVIRKIYWLGTQGYEGVLSELWRRLCAQSQGVLEVGGNIGLYACLGASRCQSRYTVMEPIPEIADQIEQNLRLNGLAQVRVLRGAAIPDAEAQEVQMQVPDEGVGMPLGAQLRRGAEVHDRRADRVLTVAGLPFRTLVPGCDLIKIDAEGVEYALLASALQELALTKPTLVLEVLPAATQLAQLVCQLARDWGHGIYVVPAYRSDRPVKVDLERFTSDTPRTYCSMDVVLTSIDLERLLSTNPTRVDR